MVAFDASERTVQLAKDRLGDSAEIFRESRDTLRFRERRFFRNSCNTLEMDHVEEWCILL